MTGSRQEFFATLYASGDPLPWDRSAVNPLLPGWAPEGTGRAIVVGCGYGADAEHLAGLGWATTAFDFVPAAVDGARTRHPGSTVDYRVADLLDPPADWRGAFDLVFEAFTVQSLPRELRTDAVAAVRDLVAPGGTLLVVAVAWREEPQEPTGPWLVTREELDGFGTGGLEPVRIDEHPREDTGRLWWKAVFTRPG